MSSLTDRRFTSSAQEIVQQMSRRAVDRGLFCVDDGSVVVLALWTLLRWELKVGLVALERMGVDLHLLSEKLDARLSRLAEQHPVVAKDGAAIFANTVDRVNPDWSTAIEPFLARSEVESRTLKHTYVGTEHLLLAIIASADVELSTILHDQHITYDCTKHTILEVLGIGK